MIVHRVVQILEEWWYYNQLTLCLVINVFTLSILPLMGLGSDSCSCNELSHAHSSSKACWNWPSVSKASSSCVYSDGRLLIILLLLQNTFLCVRRVLRWSHLACNSSSNLTITSPSSSTHLLFSACPVVITAFSSFSLPDTFFSVAYSIPSLSDYSIRIWSYLVSFQLILDSIQFRLYRLNFFLCFSSSVHPLAHHLIWPTMYDVLLGYYQSYLGYYQ